MKRTGSIVILLVLVSLLLCGCGDPCPHIGCSNPRLWWIADDEDWIIGKTKEQIEAKYGEFDWYGHRKIYDPATDTFLPEENFTGSYTIHEGHPGYLGYCYDVYFEIVFDQDGRARRCERELVDY